MPFINALHITLPYSLCLYLNKKNLSYIIMDTYNINYESVIILQYGDIGYPITDDESDTDDE